MHKLLIYWGKPKKLQPVVPVLVAFAGRSCHRSVLKNFVSNRRKIHLAVCGLGLSLFIFALDLRLPLGVAGVVPYVAVVLLGLLTSGTGFVIAAAITSSILTLLGLHLSPPGGEFWLVFTNRILAIFAIWVTAGLCLLQKRYEKKLLDNQKLLESRVEEKTEDAKRAMRHMAMDEKRIKQYAEDLIRSNRELDEFAFIVSHDLKEPLRGIYNYSSFLKEDYGDVLDAEGCAKLDTLQRLTRRMEVLISTILRYSRLGKSKVSMKPEDLNAVVKEALDNLGSRLSESNAEVRFEENLPEVVCNRVQMVEVFQNLIANAVRYNDKPEKRVEIGILRNPLLTEDNTRDPDVFYVRDNGIGIQEKHFESLFQIFKRLNGKEKFGEGTGAGTTISKKIIEQHGGRIWLESTVGKGTTFYFTLSAENPQSADPAPAASEEALA